MTPAGAFRVDAEGAVQRWMGLQQADDQSHYEEFVHYEPPSTDVPMAGAALGSAHRLAMGSSATVWLRGTSVALLGAIEGEAEVALRVDGVEIGATTSSDVPLGGVLARADGLAGGPHEVVLTATPGDGVLLDAAQGIEASAPLTFDGPDGEDAPKGCGCAATAPESDELGLLAATLLGAYTTRARLRRRPLGEAGNQGARLSVERRLRSRRG